jgi:hypothetical protein
VDLLDAPGGEGPTRSPLWAELAADETCVNAQPDHGPRRSPSFLRNTGRSLGCSSSFLEALISIRLSPGSRAVSWSERYADQLK